MKDNYFSDRASHAFAYAIKNADDYTSGNYYGWAGSTTEDNNYFLVEATGGTT